MKTAVAWAVLATAIASLPPPLDVYTTKYLKLTAAEQQRLLAGEAVTKLLESDPSTEVAVFGGVWVNAPVASYLAAVKDIETFESGDAFRVTKKLSTPPALSDFDRLTLPEDDAADLRTCRVGDCEMKLSQSSMDRIRREVDWNKPTARADLDRIS